MTTPSPSNGPRPPTRSSTPSDATAPGSQDRDTSAAAAPARLLRRGPRAVHTPGLDIHLFHILNQNVNFTWRGHRKAARSHRKAGPGRSATREVAHDGRDQAADGRDQAAPPRQRQLARLQRGQMTGRPMTGQPPAAPGGWALRPQTNACRTAHDLSGVWSFRLDPGDEGGERGWWRGIPDAVPAAVPGSWNEQVPGARDELGPAWYERRFEMPPMGGQQVAIRFGSAVYAARAWLNGQPLGEHEGGHLPFALPCSAALATGENVLVATPRHGVSDLRLQTVLDGGAATLDAAVQAGDGEVTLALDGEPITCPHRVERAQLWHPDSPRLHRLDVELRRGGALADRYTLRAGLRTVAVDADRLLLNGEPVELRGFGRHEDFPVLGRGAVPALAARDLLLMRELGANSLRTAHYP